MVAGIMIARLCAAVVVRRGGSPPEPLDPRVSVLCDLDLEAVDPAHEGAVRREPDVERVQHAAAARLGCCVGHPADRLLLRSGTRLGRLRGRGRPRTRGFRWVPAWLGAPVFSRCRDDDRVFAVGWCSPVVRELGLDTFSVVDPPGAFYRSVSVVERAALPPDRGSAERAVAHAPHLGFSRRWASTRVRAAALRCRAARGSTP